MENPQSLENGQGFLKIPCVRNGPNPGLELMSPTVVAISLVSSLWDSKRNPKDLKIGNVLIFYSINK